MKRKIKITKNFKNSLILLFLTIICLEILTLFAIKKSVILSSLSNDRLTKYANQIVLKCSTSNYHPTCYDKEIPKLMDYISMEDAFKVTRIVQDKDQTYQYCHVLAHELSVREVDKDPSKWEDIISRCPSGTCSNGCLHGGFQERFRAESLTDSQIEAIKPDLKNLCEDKPSWHPTGLEQASCYHAIGHLTMYMTSADINKSIKLCKEIALKDNGRDYTQLCFDGVFMQIFQPLEPEDFALVKGKQPKKEDLAYFCRQFEGKKRGSCFSESWPLFREELQRPEGLVAFCSQEDVSEQTRCYSSIFYVLTAQFGFNEKKISDYCAGLPSERRGLCFANAASRMIETDYRNISKAVNLCDQSPLPEEKTQCFQELLLYSTYNFHKGSKEFYQMCNSLPGDWKQMCINHSRT